MIVRLTVATLTLVVATVSTAMACGPDTDCVIGDRTYRIALPENRNGTEPVGAIVFVHGFRGTAASTMRNETLLGIANELGVALVAPQAPGVEWNIPHIPSVDVTPGVDELAYFDALIRDATERFGIDPARLMVAGFSSGGMMVWTLACDRGTSFAGFAPLSGTFWDPLPEDCPTGPVNLIHYHGRQDPIVPLYGRQIKDAHQGDVHEAIELIARTSDYGPAESNDTPELQCTRRVDSANRLLELCLFEGRHELRSDHIVRAWHAFRLD